MGEVHDVKAPFIHRFAQPLRQPFVLVIIAAYFVVCIGYAIVTPFGKAPDENAHHFYARYIAEYHRLPVLQPGDEWHEAHQPPLFYLIGALIYSIADKIPYDGDAEVPPATIWALRLFCMLCGSITVLAAFHLSATLFPREPMYARFAIAFAGLHAMHAFINSSINSDNFAEALCSLLLIYIIWHLFTNRMDWWKAVTIGIFIGCIGITKYLAWSALAGIGYAVGWNIIRFRIDVRRCIGYAFCMIGIATILCGWWYIRNIAVYGDPLGQRVYIALSEHAAQPSWFFAMGYSVAGYFAFAARYLFWTFWGLFGLTDIFLPNWAYWMWLVPTVISATGIIRYWWRCRMGVYQLDDVKRGQWHFALIWLVALLLLYLRFLTYYFSAQMRHLFPLFALIALLFSLGIIEWLPEQVRERLRYPLPWAIAGLLFIYNMVCIMVVIPSAHM